MCEALSCLFTALWLPVNPKDTDMTCSKMLPIQAATCLQVGPMSLDWPVEPFARFDYSRSSLSPEAPCDEQQRGVLPASTRCRRKQSAVQAPLHVLQRATSWDGCGPFLSEGLRRITCNTRGLVGTVFLQTKKEGIQTQLSKKTLGQQQHHLSPGSAWKGRISSSYPGVGFSIPALWYLSS